MIKLTFLGDIMCKKELIEAFKVNNGYDFHEIFVKMENYFQKSGFNNWKFRDSNIERYKRFVKRKI